MKVWIRLIILSLLFILSGCTDVSSEYLKFELMPGVDTVEVGTSHTDSGATASYGLRSLNITVIYNDVDINQVGTYEIVYEATYSNISKVIRRKVNVVDQTPPIVTLKPGIDTILVGDTWIDSSIDITDQSEIRSITVTGEVKNEVGDYTITYTVIDVYGNTAIVMRIVSVLAPKS
jgi:hypothetical protein